VAGERRRRIVAQLLRDAPDVATKHLCSVCVELTGMSGAGIMLMAGDLPQGSVCTSDGVSKIIEDLQYALGEGPCIDAHNLGQPVLEPDLAEPSTPRWAAFTGPAVDAGVRAIFGFPLRVGAVRLGALNLYCDRSGPLTAEQHADSLVAADVATHAILALQANAPPGQLAVELESGSDFRYVVHQASGMVAVQLGVSVGQALIRLRAYAFGNERPLTDVARDVVARVLRFDAPSDENDTVP
jgi:hypothetical protein